MNVDLNMFQFLNQQIGYDSSMTGRESNFAERKKNKTLSDLLDQSPEQVLNLEVVRFLNFRIASGVALC